MRRLRCKYFYTHFQIFERMFIGGCGLGFFAGNQIKLGQFISFCILVDKFDAMVELICDIKDFMYKFVRRGFFKQLPTHFQMDRRPFVFRNKRINRLLYPVMGEPVFNRQPARRFRQIKFYRLVCISDR